MDDQNRASVDTQKRDETDKEFHGKKEWKEWLRNVSRAGKWIPHCKRNQFAPHNKWPSIFMEFLLLAPPFSAATSGWVASTFFEALASSVVVLGSILRTTPNNLPPQQNVLIPFPLLTVVYAVKVSSPLLLAVRSLVAWMTCHRRCVINTKALRMCFSRRCSNPLHSLHTPNCWGYLFISSSCRFHRYIRYIVIVPLLFVAWWVWEGENIE